MIVEWDVPFELTLDPPSIGSGPDLPGLLFNQLMSLGTDPLGYYMLDPSRCQAGAAQRITRNNLAQKDGEITHRKFKSGYVIELNVQMWEQIGTEGVPACGGVLREMADTLDLYLNSIENADGRLTWQPSAWPVGSPDPNERMLDKVRTLGPSGGGGGSEFVSVVVEKDPESPLTTVTFAMLSPIPYTMDAPQTTTDITHGGTIHNGGTTNFFPVLEVYGPTNDFILTNTSVRDENGNPLKLAYDASLPGAQSIFSGQYVEFDFFRSTAYLNGNQSNRKAGIDVGVSDFFPLAPGDNVLTVSAFTGSQILLKWQAAYV